MSAAHPWLDRLAPFRRWLPHTTRDSLRADLVAGIVGAIIVLPQGVAFATLAGLPPQYGLYAAMVPAIVGALWGSSHHLVSGPTNAISLVVFATMSQLAEPGSSEYVGLVITLAFVVGLMQLAMGLAKLGTLVNFISHTVVVGFTAGAGMLIIASQLKNFFGVPIARGLSFPATLQAFAGLVGDAQPYVLATGLITLAVGLAAKRWYPKIPYMIVAMLAGSLAAWAFNRWLAAGVTTLGALPGALPGFSAPSLAADTIRHLMGAALAVTVLGLTEAISIARSLAVKSGQRIDANQEFIGQGLSNIAGSFFSAYPTSGSFNRSGANLEAGARTPLAAVFAALVLVLVVLLVAPLAAYLPHAAMAAILLLVAWGLIDFHHIAEILRASRSEAAILAVTFVATLVMHLEFAILAGVMLSLMLYLNRTSRPSIRSLIPDPADPRRKFRERGPGEAECPQLKILRIEGSLYFGAVNHVGEYLHELAERRHAQQHLLLMARSMNFIDVAGAELLAREAQRRRAAGGGLYLHSPRERAAAMLKKPVFAAAFPPDSLFQSKRGAIAGVVGRFDPQVCRGCRARIFNECAAMPAPDPDAVADAPPAAP